MVPGNAFGDIKQRFLSTVFRALSPECKVIGLLGVATLKGWCIVSGGQETEFSRHSSRLYISAAVPKHCRLAGWDLVHMTFWVRASPTPWCSSTCSHWWWTDSLHSHEALSKQCLCIHSSTGCGIKLLSRLLYSIGRTKSKGWITRQHRFCRFQVIWRIRQYWFEDIGCCWWRSCSQA